MTASSCTSTLKFMASGSGDNENPNNSTLDGEQQGVIAEYGAELRELGFPIDDLTSGEAVVPASKEIVSSGAGEGVAEDEGWEVEVLRPIVGEEDYSDWVCYHRQAARLCKVLNDELCEVPGDSEGLVHLAEQLWRAEAHRDWLESVLSACQCEEDFLGSIRALGVDVPLGESNDPGGDQFLQTRNVSLLEARKELEKWKEPALDEVVSLETTNRAVDRVLASDVDKWAQEGMSVVQHPGKAVLTRKAGVGKRRFRAVCCGNYLLTEKLGLTREELYASGAEALSVKVAVTYAASHRSWTGVTIDVKSAFLYAPIRTENQGTEERIIVKPPHLLVELGILSAEHRWWIRKALYMVYLPHRGTGVGIGTVSSVSFECRLEVWNTSWCK